MKSTEEMVESASKIKKVENFVAEEYSTKKNMIKKSFEKRIYANEKFSNFMKNYSGSIDNDQMEDSYDYRTQFMESIFKNYNPQTLVSTYIWAMKMIISRKAGYEIWDIQMNVMLESLQETLSKESFEQISPYYLWMIDNLPNIVEIAKKMLEDEKHDYIESKEKLLN